VRPAAEERSMTLTIIVATLLTLAVLGIGGVATTIGPWYQIELRKPAWTPPNWAFGPAWTLILACAAWAGVLAWTHAAHGAAHIRIAVLFVVTTVLQIAWSPLFFNLKRPDWALIEVAFLWLSILALAVGLAPYSTLADLLLAPYLAWVAFAAVLNLAIVRMNPPFGRRNA
jgi:tryptophan-rich sensory protein